MLCPRRLGGERTSIRVWCGHVRAAPSYGNQVRTRDRLLTVPGIPRRKQSKKSARRGSVSLDKWGPHTCSARCTGRMTALALPSTDSRAPPRLRLRLLAVLHRSREQHQKAEKQVCPQREHQHDKPHDKATREPPEQMQWGHTGHNDHNAPEGKDERCGHQGWDDHRASTELAPYAHELPQ